MLPWTPCTFILTQITLLLIPQSLNRLNSGYSRIPVHEQGDPLAFRGLLLVKKVLFDDVSPEDPHSYIALL